MYNGVVTDVLKNTRILKPTLAGAPYSTLSPPKVHHSQCETTLHSFPAFLYSSRPPLSLAPPTLKLDQAFSSSF